MLLWILALSICHGAGQNLPGQPQLVQDRDWTARPFLGNPGNKYEGVSNLNIQLNQGVVFRDMGDISVSGNFWTLVIEVDLSELHEKIGDFMLSLSTYKNALERVTFSGKIDSVKGINNVVKGTIETHLQGAIQFNNSMKLTQQKYTELKLAFGTNSRRRGKRAIIGGIGDIMRPLFGLATDNQIDDLNNHINTLRRSDESIFQLLEKQATILKATVSRSKQHDTLLNQLSEASDQISSKVNELIEDIGDIEEDIAVIPHIISALKLLNGLSVQALAYSDWKTLLEEDLMKLETALESTAAGKISSHFISIEDFLEALSEVDRNLPPTLSLAIPVTREFLYQYYNFIDIKTSGNNDKIRIFAHLPLISPERKFRLYEAIPWPSPIENGSDTVFVIDVDNKFIAQSLDRQYFFELTDKEAAECTNELRICSPSSPIYSSPYASCLFSLLTHTKTPASCNHRIAEIQHPQFLKIGDPNIWLYYTKTPLTISETCMPFDAQQGVQVEITTLHGAGIYNLAANCSAKTNGITLPTNFRASSYVRVEHVERIRIPQLIPFSDMFSQHKLNQYKDIPLLKETLSNRKLSPLTNLGMDVDLLNKEIRSEKDKIGKEWNLRFINHSQAAQWITWVGILVPMTLWFGWLYLKPKIINLFAKKTDNTDVETEGTGQETEPPQTPSAPPKPKARESH